MVFCCHTRIPEQNLHSAALYYPENVYCCPAFIRFPCKYSAGRKTKGLDTPLLSDWTEKVLYDNFYGTTWNKVSILSVPADTITAYYHRADRGVNYNDGNYVTDSIYEHKFLEGKDLYGVFYSSDQATAVIEGGGERGNLLLITDSFANTFARFVLDDYTEAHMIDLRFFRDNVT